MAQDGEELARAVCSGCHSFPEPALLDRETWLTAVLPEMGARLGFRAFRGAERDPSPDAPAGVYAPEPVLEVEEWERIIAWYESQAPEELRFPEWQERTPLELFDIELPGKPEEDFPTSTAIFIDEETRRVLVGDSHGLDLEVYSDNLGLLGEVQLNGAISRIARLPDGDYLAAIMGEIIGPTEELSGRLVEIAAGEEIGVAVAEPLVRRLHRPVDMEFGDFNGDGVTDFVTASFGNHTGEVRLSLSQPGGIFEKQSLISEAGATALGMYGSDLYVLMAQGNERIVRLSGIGGDGPVREETIIRFPPAYGSSSMKVMGFDGDGLTVLLVTAGDNADLTTIYKPYHGIYLYSEQPDGSFRQTFFFHLDGTYNAVAEDFDADGDVDIAAVSFFPDTTHGFDQTAFLYLENNGDGFVPRHVEGLGELGRFVAISAGDLDGDGDKDIALANMAFGPYGPMEVSIDRQLQWIAGPHFVLLRNGLR